MPDPVWMYTVLVCDSTGTDHDRCGTWFCTGEPPNSDREEAFRAARTHQHARVLQHPEDHPHLQSLAFEHRTDGGPCAACPTGRGPCADTPAGPLFLCSTCLELLDNELQRSLAALNLPHTKPLLAPLSPATTSPP